MEGDIVFPDKLEELHLFSVLPPIAPIIGVVGCNRDVTYGGIKPDVENLIFIPLLRDRNPPLEVAGYGSLSKAVPYPRLGSLDCISGPKAFNRSLIHPLLKKREGFGEINIEVFGS